MVLLGTDWNTPELIGASTEDMNASSLSTPRFAYLQDGIDEAHTACDIMHLGTLMRCPIVDIFHTTYANLSKVTLRDSN